MENIQGEVFVSRGKVCPAFYVLRVLSLSTLRLFVHLHQLQQHLQFLLLP